jgi:hypothetical protein
MGSSLFGSLSRPKEHATRATIKDQEKNKDDLLVAVIRQLKRWHPVSMQYAIDSDRPASGPARF